MKVVNLIHQTLRIRCFELAVHLQRGAVPAALLDEVVDLTKDCWELLDMERKAT